MKHALRFALAALPILLLLGWVALRAAVSPEERLREQVDDLVAAFNRQDQGTIAEILGGDFALEPGDLDEAELSGVLWAAFLGPDPLHAELEPGSFAVTEDPSDPDARRVALTLLVSEAAGGAPWIVRVTAEARDRGRGWEPGTTWWTGEGEAPDVDLSGASLSFMGGVRIVSTPAATSVITLPPPPPSSP